MKEDKPEIINLGSRSAYYVKGKPSRLETPVVFDGLDISQKLVFQMMNISHRHGFGCTSPQFKVDGDREVMVFCIGTIVDSRSLSKYIDRLSECMVELDAFEKEFNRQLDFSMLDVSMFVGIDLNMFDPQTLSAVRDQHYDGDWQLFYESMIKSEKQEEADMVFKCMKFEEINGKDIGLIGHHLENIFYMIEGGSLLLGDN